MSAYPWQDQRQCALLIGRYQSSGSAERAPVVNCVARLFCEAIGKSRSTQIASLARVHLGTIEKTATQLVHFVIKLAEQPLLRVVRHLAERCGDKIPDTKPTRLDRRQRVGRRYRSVAAGRFAQRSVQQRLIRLAACGKRSSSVGHCHARARHLLRSAGKRFAFQPAGPQTTSA